MIFAAPSRNRGRHGLSFVSPCSGLDNCSVGAPLRERSGDRQRWGREIFGNIARWNSLPSGPRIVFPNVRLHVAGLQWRSPGRV